MTTTQSSHINDIHNDNCMTDTSEVTICKNSDIFNNYMLNTTESLQYLNNDGDYINYINNKDKYNCICLNINHCEEITTITIDNSSFLTKFCKLDTNKCYNLISIHDIKLLIELEINYCNNLTIIYNLKMLNKLYIYDCNNLINIYNLTSLQIMDLNYCKNISDISMLYLLNKLYVFDCNIYGYHLLKNIDDIQIIVDIKIKNQINKLKKYKNICQCIIIDYCSQNE